jgi:hypothetical protein
MELVLTSRGVAASHSGSGPGANTDQCGPQLDSVIEELTLNSCVVAYPSVAYRQLPIRQLSNIDGWRICRN